jgi:selenocysteine lyase/cysteine desulfurase
MIDVAALRAATPGCATGVAYLENAGAGLPSRATLDTIVAHLRREAEIGGYAAAAEASGRIDRLYRLLAQLVDGTADEIALVDSATRAWTTFFGGFAATLRPGDRILTHRVEYASNMIALLQAARQREAVVDVVPSAPTGEIDVDALASMLDDRTRLVTLTHVPSQQGLVNPAEAVGAVTSAVGVPLLLDACQSIGQLDVSVTGIRCDALVATGRKFLRGPRGTGFLWVRAGRFPDLEPVAPDLRGAEWTGPREYELAAGARRFEQWERPYALFLGLANAVEEALALGLPEIEARVTALASRARAGLAAVPGVAVHDEGRRRSAIVTFAVAGHDAASVVARLGERRIRVGEIGVGTGRLDLGDRGLAAVVRAAPHCYTTEDEVDALVDAVASLGRPSGSGSGSAG